MHRNRSDTESGGRTLPDSEPIIAAMLRICEEGNQDPDVLALFVSIECQLERYGISQDCLSPAEIIYISFARGLSAITCGRPIVRAIAWITHDSRKVIRDIRDIQEREQALDRKTDATDPSAEKAADIEASLEERHLANLAFAQLPYRHRLTIEMQVVKGLNGRQTQATLHHHGDPCSLSAIRKRKERAVKRLRKSYSLLSLPVA